MCVCPGQDILDSVLGDSNKCGLLHPSSREKRGKGSREEIYYTKKINLIEKMRKKEMRKIRR